MTEAGNNYSEKKTQLHISVRNLVEFIFREGDIDNRSSRAMSADAMMEGTRIHRKIQGSMGKEYQAEVPLSLVVEGDLYELTVEGRADGIFTEDGKCFVDEIKGMYRKVELFEKPVFVHRAQAMCYAYIFALQNNMETIGIQMTYCNLETEQTKYFREDFCEFGLGMVMGNKKMKERIAHLLEEAKASEKVSAEFVAAADKWMANMNDSEGSKEAAAELKPLIAAGAEKGCPICKELKTLDHYLVKRSQWIIGGDGASYDIGYGGLDHVLASGEDVNILVLDTEVYSNTGGQSSKSTPLGAIAQFAAQGKRIRKKDLGLMQTTYGYIYVAQVAMGADNAQTLKAIREAEAYPGPSLIIAYAPCINHGLKRKGGMGRSQHEEELAVECGYWHLWRYNPLLADEGKNPFTLDSKAPNWENFRDFLLGEVRYLSVQKAFPKEADELFSQAEKMAKLRYQTYVRKSQEDWSEQI